MDEKKEPEMDPALRAAVEGAIPEMQRLEAEGWRMGLELDARHALGLLAALQLAMVHPAMPATTFDIVEAVAKEIHKHVMRASLLLGTQMLEGFDRPGSARGNTRELG